MTSNENFELCNNIKKMDSDFTNGQIILDNPKEIYYSGQIISGKLQLKLNSKLTFTGIHVLFHGEARVCWADNESEEQYGQKRYRLVNYEGHQNYFQTVHTLVGGNGITHLQPGSHSLPFEYKIPHISPSSYDGDKGKVAYRVVAYVDFPYPNIKREEIVKEFKVVAPLDLNKANRAVRQAFQIELEQTYSSCFSSKLVNVKVELPMGGYCPGQTIPAEIYVDNQSSCEINKIKLKLVQKTRYHSQNPHSEFTCPEEVLVSKKIGPILGKVNKKLICNLVIPAMIPVCLENCSIIDVGYFYKVTVKMTGCNDDMEDECEICLGLVPLRRSVIGTYTHPMAYNLPDGPIPDPNQPSEPVGQKPIPDGPTPHPNQPSESIRQKPIPDNNPNTNATAPSAPALELVCDDYPSDHPIIGFKA